MRKIWTAAIVLSKALCVKTHGALFELSEFNLKTTWKSSLQKKNPLRTRNSERTVIQMFATTESGMVRIARILSFFKSFV